MEQEVGVFGQFRGLAKCSLCSGHDWVWETHLTRKSSGPFTSSESHVYPFMFTSERLCMYYCTIGRSGIAPSYASARLSCLRTSYVDLACTFEMMNVNTASPPTRDLGR